MTVKDGKRKCKIKLYVNNDCNHRKKSNGPKLDWILKKEGSLSFFFFFSFIFVEFILHCNGAYHVNFPKFSKSLRFLYFLI